MAKSKKQKREEALARLREARERIVAFYGKAVVMYSDGSGDNKYWEGRRDEALVRIDAELTHLEDIVSGKIPADGSKIKKLQKATARRLRKLDNGRS